MSRTRPEPGGTGIIPSMAFCATWDTRISAWLEFGVGVLIADATRELFPSIVLMTSALLLVTSLMVQHEALIGWPWLESLHLLLLTD